jgi:hypothetical protein
MSYVEHCKKHGQYHGEICAECFEDLKVENSRLRKALEYITNSELCSKCEYQMKLIDCMHGRSVYEIARAALEEK